MATLHEIRTHWHLEDLADCHEYLQIKHEAEAHAAAQQREHFKKGA